MTARIGAPKTGGRKRGSIDREARKLLTDKMSADLMWCYGKLGGRTWLLEFAEKNPAEFIRQGLSRLWPSPQKDDGDFVQNNTQVNIGDMSSMEAARRVAFALALGAHSDNTSAPIELVQDETVEPVTPRRPDAPPEAIPNRWQPPSDAPWVQEPTDMSSPDDADRAKWAEGLSLTPEQKLVRETKEATLSTYRGGAPEQGYDRAQRQSFERDPRAAARDRLLARRRDKLL